MLHSISMRTIASSRYNVTRLVYCELSFSYPYRRRFTAGTSRMRLASAKPLEDQVLLLTINIVLPSLPASCVLIACVLGRTKDKCWRHFPVRTGPSAKGSTRLYLAIALRVEESLHGLRTLSGIKQNPRPTHPPFAAGEKARALLPSRPPPPNPANARTHDAKIPGYLS